MKSSQAGMASGCVTWFIVFLLLGSCLVPVGVIVGGITSGLNADFVTRTLGPYMCPEGSTAEVHTFTTAGRDVTGFGTLTTAYEARCVNTNGVIVKDLGPTLGFIWTGIVAAIGFIAALLLAFLSAAPVGAIVGNFLNHQANV